MSKLIALVGMPGAGKTRASEFFTEIGYQRLRFGQIVLDEAIRLGSVNEKTESIIRNNFRKRCGKGAMAILNLSKIDTLLKKGPVVIDGLYSWAEYKVLKKNYDLAVIAILAPPEIRYQRLTNRVLDLHNDPKAINRSLSPVEAQFRDQDQIENADQGGPIAMADHFIVNDGSRQHLLTQLKRVSYRLVNYYKAKIYSRERRY